MHILFFLWFLGVEYDGWSWGSEVAIMRQPAWEWKGEVLEQKDKSLGSYDVIAVLEQPGITSCGLLVLDIIEVLIG